MAEVYKMKNQGYLPLLSFLHQSTLGYVTQCQDDPRRLALVDAWKGTKSRSIPVSTIPAPRCGSSILNCLISLVQRACLAFFLFVCSAATFCPIKVWLWSSPNWELTLVRARSSKVAFASGRWNLVDCNFQLGNKQCDHLKTWKLFQMWKRISFLALFGNRCAWIGFESQATATPFLLCPAWIAR